VYCGQTVGRINVKLGTQVGLGPGHIVLHGEPAPLFQRGRSRRPPIFGPYLLQPNGWMDQDATWYRGRPRPSEFVLDGDPAPPPQKGGRTPSPKLSAHFHCSQTAGWIKMVLGIEVGLSSVDFVLDGYQLPPSANRGRSPVPNYCGQTAGCIKMQLGMEIGLSPRDVVLDGDPTSSPEGGEAPSQKNSANV